MFMRERETLKLFFVVLLVCLITSIVYSAAPLVCSQQVVPTFIKILLNSEEDPTGGIINISLTYENISANPPRQPLKFSPVFLYLSNDSWGNLFLTFTNENGTAAINASAHIPGPGCYKAKMIYCSLGDPLTSACLKNAGVRQELLDDLRHQ